MESKVYVSPDDIISGVGKALSKPDGLGLFPGFPFLSDSLSTASQK